MPRTLTVPLGDAHTMTLLPPLSARQRQAVLGERWTIISDAVGETSPAAAGVRAIALDLAAARAVLAMQPTVEPPIGVVSDYLAGRYVDIGDARGVLPMDAAADDLLTWCDEHGVTTADLHYACNQAGNTGATPTAAQVETVRGN